MTLETPATAFWEWFEAHADHYRPGPGGLVDDTSQLDLLLSALHAVDPRLHFIIGGEADQDPEFIVTAGGEIEAFPAVEDLVAAAPAIPGWQIIAFKQPMPGGDLEVEIDGIKLADQDLVFVHLYNELAPTEFGIRVLIDGYDPAREDHYITLVWLLIEALLGERTTGLDLHYFDLGDQNDPAYVDVELIPMSELLPYFEWVQGLPDEEE